MSRRRCRLSQSTRRQNLFVCPRRVPWARRCRCGRCCFWCCCGAFEIPSESHESAKPGKCLRTCCLSYCSLSLFILLLLLLLLLLSNKLPIGNHFNSIEHSLRFTFSFSLSIQFVIYPIIDDDFSSFSLSNLTPISRSKRVLVVLSLCETVCLSLQHQQRQHQESSEPLFVSLCFVHSACSVAAAGLSR